MGGKFEVEVGQPGAGFPLPLPSERITGIVRSLRGGDQIVADWFVAQTVPNSERLACEQASLAGFNPYLPMFQSVTVKRGARLVKDCILFPGYLFVEALRDWHSLSSLRGVRDLIMNGERPGRLLDAEMNQIMERQNTAGYVVLPERPDISRFRRGQTVRAVSGVFRSYEGLYQGVGPHGRVQVLFALLGRKVRVAVDEEDLVAA